MTDTWELLARWPGGTVAALASAGGSGAVATTAAGLHTSSDGGRTWTWSGLGPDPVAEAVAVSPHFVTDQTVLLGTGSGVHRSIDGGKTWRPVLVGSRVQCVAATPDFATGDGIVLVGTQADGLLRSEDGGRGWSGANAGLLDLDVTAVALSPAFARDRTAFAGTASGLYRSRNGGRAWRLVELSPEAPAVQAIAVSPSFGDEGLVLAGTERDGLFRSEDGGQRWEPVAAFPEPCVTCLAFASGPGSQRIVVAGTAAGVAVSRDGGETWTLEAPELGPILSVAVAEGADGGAVLAGTTEAGIVRRPLDGTGWTPANQGLAGRATVGLAASTAFGPVPLLVVATLDTGILLSHDAGDTWAIGHGGLADLAASAAAIVRRTDGLPSVLATFAGGVFRSEDLDEGWRPVEIGTDPDACPTALSVAGDTGHGSSMVLAAGRGSLSLSLDGGAAWRAIPLPRPDAEIVSAAGSPDLARDRTLYAVVRATRTATDGTVEHDGLELWHSDDLGRRWSRWLHSPNATVMPVVVPRAGDLDTAVLVGHAGRVGRPLRRAQEVRRGERRPLWQEAQIGNLQSAVTALAISPHVRRDRTVLAAADAGVYLTRDGGATFGAWDHDLDVPLVTALALTATADDGLDAYALGLGGTLWRRRL